MNSTGSKGTTGDSGFSTTPNIPSDTNRELLATTKAALLAEALGCLPPKKDDSSGHFFYYNQAIDEIRERLNRKWSGSDDE